MNRREGKRERKDAERGADEEKREKAEVVLVMVVERRSGWEREGG